MTAIRSASWSASSRYCVVSSTVQPWATSSRMVSHIWPRVRGSRPVVGSSRKISGGREIRLAARSSRRRMPPENWEICLSRGLLEAEPAEQLARRSRATRFLSTAEQPAEQAEVLAGGEVLVDRGVLAGDADQLAHHVRVLLRRRRRRSAPAAVHREQRGEHLEHRGLAGAVGSEDAEDLAAAYLQVDAVDGPEVAEGLHEAVGSDGQLGRGGGVRVHDHDSGRPGFQPTFTPVSRPAAGFTVRRRAHASLDVAQRLIPLSTASCSIASSSSWEISRLSSDGEVVVELLDAAGTDQHRGDPLVAQHPRQRELGQRLAARLRDLVRAARMCASASSVSRTGPATCPGRRASPPGCRRGSGR